MNLSEPNMPIAEHKEQLMPPEAMATKVTPIGSEQLKELTEEYFEYLCVDAVEKPFSE